VLIRGRQAAWAATARAGAAAGAVAAVSGAGGGFTRAIRDGRPRGVHPSAEGVITRQCGQRVAESAISDFAARDDEAGMGSELCATGEPGRQVRCAGVFVSRSLVRLLRSLTGETVRVR